MPSNLKFRDAYVDDLPAIVRLLADDPLGATREKAGPPIDPRYLQAFAAIEKDSNQRLVVVERAGELVGCLQISFIPGLSRLGAWRGQIESVRIAQRHRGGGLGRLMFDWAIGTCRDRGCDLVQLTSDKQRLDSIKFYEGLGFEASHEGLKLSLAPIGSEEAT